MEISKRSNGQKKHVITIPKEVVIEILQRVPGQDLAEKLKMVCMQWCSIIYGGSFAYSHIEHQIKSSSFSQLEAVVIKTAIDQQSIAFSSLEWHSYSQNHDQFEDWKTKDLYTTKVVWSRTFLARDNYDKHMMTTANSMNGFVCFWSNRGACFHIFNPVSKEHVTTPMNSYIGTIRKGHTAVGFGFCPLTYDYKVVVLDSSTSSKIKPLVFTIGRDHYWRPLEDIPHHICEEVQTVTYVKGKLYWYAMTCTSADKHLKYETRTLICFDVSKEEFNITVVPIEILEGSVSVAKKGGRLHLVIISCGPVCSLLIQVYVAHSIDDLSSLNSWKKEFTVTAPSIAYLMDGLEHVYLIRITDEILVIQLDEREWGFFDVANGKLLALFPMPHFVTTTIPYVPSLVTLRHHPLLASSS